MGENSTHQNWCQNWRCRPKIKHSLGKGGLGSKTSLDSWHFLISKGKEEWLFSDTKDLGYFVSQGLSFPVRPYSETAQGGFRSIPTHPMHSCNKCCLKVLPIFVLRRKEETAGRAECRLSTWKTWNRAQLALGWTPGLSEPHFLNRANNTLPLPYLLGWFWESRDFLWQRGLEVVIKKIRT